MRIIAILILIPSLLLVTGQVGYSSTGAPINQPNIKSDWLGIIIIVVLILLPVLIYKFSNRKPSEFHEEKQEQETHKEIVDSRHGDNYQK